MTISLGLWSTEPRNSSQTSWCRHWWFSSRYVFTSFLSGLHSGVVPSAGFHSLPSAVITNDGGLNTLPSYGFCLHNLENHNTYDQTIGNMSCTTWRQKRDGCFSSLCGKREGVNSVISGVKERCAYPYYFTAYSQMMSGVNTSPWECVLV